MTERSWKISHSWRNQRLSRIDQRRSDDASDQVGQFELGGQAVEAGPPALEVPRDQPIDQLDHPRLDRLDVGGGGTLDHEPAGAGVGNQVADRVTLA